MFRSVSTVQTTSKRLHVPKRCLVSFHVTSKRSKISRVPPPGSKHQGQRHGSPSLLELPLSLYSGSRERRSAGVPFAIATERCFDQNVIASRLLRALTPLASFKTFCNETVAHSYFQTVHQHRRLRPLTLAPLSATSSVGRVPGSLSGRPIACQGLQAWAQPPTHFADSRGRRAATNSLKPALRIVPHN